MNRPVRDPYAGWCERRTSSEKSGEAVYSIMPSPFFQHVKLLLCLNVRLSMLEVIFFLQ